MWVVVRGGCVGWAMCMAHWVVGVVRCCVSLVSGRGGFGGSMSGVGVTVTGTRVMDPMGGMGFDPMNMGLDPMMMSGMGLYPMMVGGLGMDAVVVGMTVNVMGPVEMDPMAGVGFEIMNGRRDPMIGVVRTEEPGSRCGWVRGARV